MPFKFPTKDKINQVNLSPQDIKELTDQYNHDHQQFLKNEQRQKAEYEQEKRYYEEQATEEEFLNWYHQQDQPNYPKPSVTVDLIALRFNDQLHTLQVLLVQRKRHPYQHKYALPGGFIEPTDKDIKAAAVRETFEETNLKVSPDHLIQLPAVGTQNRDPRGWTITNPHILLVPFNQQNDIKPKDDAESVKWHNLNLHPDGSTNYDSISNDELAFDHAKIIKSALILIKTRVINNRYDLDLLTKMLPAKFKITNLLSLFHAFAPGKYQSGSASFENYYRNYLQQTGTTKEPGVNRPVRTFKYVNRKEN